MERARSAEALADELLAAGHVDPRDKALATELVYGVLRQQLRLDHALAPRIRQGLEQLEPLGRALLRLGAYQILMLDRVPGPIAVSATQDAAQVMRAGRLKGLLNAVLRRIVHEGEDLPSGDSDKALGVRYSLPEFIIRELRQAFPDDVEREAAALRERPRVTLHPRGSGSAAEALAAEGIATEPGPHGTLTVVSGDAFATKAWRDGLFVAQDPASVAVVDLFGDVAGARVLDLCAGRGIKATALAGRGAEVVAVDIVAAKLDAAADLARQLGVRDKLTLRCGDPTRDDLGLGLYDRVLVDAPCTGLGTIRKRPEIAWRVRPNAIQRLAKLQDALIEAALRHLAPGGELLFAVCSFSAAEGRVRQLEGAEPFGETIRIPPSSGLDAFVTWRARAGQGTR